MSIIRSKRSKNFTIIGNHVYADNHLSWQAQGLLSYLLSKPDNWSISPEQLTNVTKGTFKTTARSGVYAILKELREIGYITMTKKSSGEVDYFIHDEPYLHNTDMGIKPDLHKPDMDKPDLPHKPLIRTDLKQELNNNKYPLNPLEGERTDAEIVIEHFNSAKETLHTELGISPPRATSTSTQNVRMVNACLKMKFTVDDCLLVIDYLKERWGHDMEMREYFCISSIFRKTKFEDKLNNAHELTSRNNPTYHHGIQKTPDWNDTSWGEDLGL